MFILSRFGDTLKYVVLHQIVTPLYLARLLDLVPANNAVQVSKRMSKISSLGCLPHCC